MSYNSLLHNLNVLLIQKKINAVLSNITSEEIENLNKIINFAVTWWLKDIDISNISHYTQDNNIDFIDFIDKSRPLSKEQIEKLDEFKISMGMTLLKTLLISSKDIDLHCGYLPYGILNSILIQSNCYFLNRCLPKKTHMTINRTQIWISEDCASKNYLAFDVNNPCDFKKLILPPNFTPSKYNFVSMYMASQCTYIEVGTYKRTRKNIKID